ncbi:MAG: hypothetical protein M3Z33_00120 [Actinomycetota bacterium]|nr:hypothetical protein [Actinomycetota bacterium]
MTDEDEDGLGSRRVHVGPGWQRLAISVFLVVSLVFMVATNLPGSKLREKLLVPGDPYLVALGLDQNWAVFAPDPRREVLDVVGRVTFADNTTRVWRFPRSGPLIGSYWDYRWRKWLEWVTADAHRGDLWDPAARYIARQEDKPGRRVKRVTLVRSFYALLPPGTNEGDRGPTQIVPYYTVNLR